MTTTQTMPVGATVRAEGVNFRFWAPAAKKVELVTEDGLTQEMQRDAHGFYECFAPGLTAGTLYRYRINSETFVADPVSRYQPQDVDGPSEVIDPASYNWRNTAWRGRPWREAIIYELHIGTFTEGGTYASATERLDSLVELGITAIELLPLAEAPGKCNWGYDGVFMYAPERCYGRPDDLKAFIDAAHDRGLMVFLDVVYNHFGPQGNYLNVYAPNFFTNKRKTPWGSAIHIDGASQQPVRDFFTNNALQWLNEYRFDGLRFDAVQEIHDPSDPPFIKYLANTIRTATPRDRHVHLILENDDNNETLLSRHKGRDNRYDAQWNDDVHHALHVIATGERIDYYRDYSYDPVGQVLRALSEGFAYQGEFSRVRGRNRGTKSTDLPGLSFIIFLQNHDQIGNRAFGDRLGHLARPQTLAALIPLVCLTPMIPMLFMGDEWNASSPFLYFCDFEPDLAKAVREGRRREFAGFPGFATASDLHAIPDPGDPKTFAASTLKWEERGQSKHAAWVRYYQEVLRIRRREIIPRLRGLGSIPTMATRLSNHAFLINYTLRDASTLSIVANLGEIALETLPTIPGKLLFATDTGTGAPLAPWGVRVHLDLGRRAHDHDVAD
jgi:maltooligosyltrehalose trehalohydrolase